MPAKGKRDRGARRWRRSVAGVRCSGDARARQRGSGPDLYFADGSMVTFEQGSLEARRLLPIAHEILAAAPAIPDGR